MTYPWAPYQRPLAVTLPITTSDPIRVNFPADRYLVDFPLVFVTVNGGPTEVTIASSKEEVTGYGEMHTHVMLTFPVVLVGKTASVWVMGV